MGMTNVFQTYVGVTRESVRVEVLLGGEGAALKQVNHTKTYS